jgi:Na+/H+ antiporter NhaD/arsenite permease-like protein
MALYVLWHYRAEWRKQSGGISPRLYQQLEKNAQIEDPDTLLRSGIVFGLVLVGFIVGEQFHIAPAVPALIGATALLVWLKPDVQRMIKAVDWTTLVFFMALFMTVGGIQEVGLISFIAGGIGQIVGTNLTLAIIVMVFGVGLLSIFIANIPLAASMLPVADFLTATIPDCLVSNPAARDVSNWYIWPAAMIPIAIIGFALALKIWNARPTRGGGSSH